MSFCFDTAALCETDPTPLYSTAAACFRLNSISQAVSMTRPSYSSFSGYSTGKVSKASPANSHLPRNSRNWATLGPALATIPPVTSPSIVPQSSQCWHQHVPPMQQAPAEEGGTYPSEQSSNSCAVKRHCGQPVRSLPRPKNTNTVGGGEE